MSGFSSERRASIAVVLSLIALFVALGGGAYATLGPGSVSTPDLRAGAVTTPKIRDGAVTSRKILRGSVRGLNIAKGTISERELKPSIFGSAVAFAEVGPSGLVVEARPRGIRDSNVGTVAPGVYCFSGLPGFSAAVATPIATFEERMPVVSVSLDPEKEGLCGFTADPDLAVVTQNLFGESPGYSLERFVVALFR